MTEVYRADLVNPNRTMAMGMYELAFMDGRLSKKPFHSFNLIQLGAEYRVQVGYAKGDQFNCVGETNLVPLPTEWDLAKAAREELRLPGNATTVFLNGKLYSKAGSV
ncbi:MAG: hypothetical protein AABX66_04260 [Nanoarchaeota archaeon]